MTVHKKRNVATAHKYGGNSRQVERITTVRSSEGSDKAYGGKGRDEAVAATIKVYSRPTFEIQPFPAILRLLTGKACGTPPILCKLPLAYFLVSKTRCPFKKYVCGMVVYVMETFLAPTISLAQLDLALKYFSIFSPNLNMMLFTVA